MRWNERQLAMLREMGIRLWLPGDAPDVSTVTVDAEPEPEPDSEPRSAVAAPSPAAIRAAPAVPSVAPPPAMLPPSQPSAVAALGWSELRAAVAACTACRLCEGRRQTVFGIGNERAHWMVVGEAPGDQEDQQGEPFVGKSGQLLDNMLRAVALGRAEAAPARQVYIANTVKCRPPGNRNPEPAELATCEPYLARQVQLVQPKIILAMGRFAVQSLLRSTEPIGRLRGRVHDYLGVPLVVTYHPAYLLRNPEDKAKAWDDLCLALETSTAQA